MNLERTVRHGQAVQWPVQAVAACASLAVAIYALSVPYIYPAWDLSITAGILGAGFAGGPLLQLAGGRPARIGPAHRSMHTIAAFTAIVVLMYALSHAPYLSPRWPPLVLTGILGLGLVADPLAQLSRGRAVDRSANSVAAFAALLVVAFALAHYFAVWPTWPLVITAGILGLGFVASRFAQLWDRVAAQRLVQIVTAVATIAFIMFALSHEQGLLPKWPLLSIAVILGLGLAAGPLAELASRPRELTERVAELSRTRTGALDVQASELRRIERDLHDGAQARLVALSMKLGRAEDRYRDDTDISAILREAREDTTSAIRDLRELARGITPPVLADRGLEAAVRSLAQRSGSEVSVTSSLGRRPGPAVETAAYFVVAESLTNAAKHAPGAPVEVRLDEHGGDLFVEITDFGPGGADWFGGGLTGLRQRVEALDGTLTLTSPAGVGTQVEAMLPCGW